MWKQSATAPEECFSGSIQGAINVDKYQTVQYEIIGRHHQNCFALFIYYVILCRVFSFTDAESPSKAKV